MDINHASHLNNKGFSTPADNLTEPRHRWYYFKEGFSNQLVDQAISDSKLKPDSIILDPFAGSGTVNLCASQRNVSSIGIEVNPFAYFLTKTKHINPSPSYIKNNLGKDTEIIVKGIGKGKVSPLLNFSTFSEFTGKSKWLFNSDVLNAFEGGYSQLKTVNSKYRGIFKLALINAAMENCNAKKDGKCLRYKTKWENLKFNKSTLLDSFADNLKIIMHDLAKCQLTIQPTLYNSDARSYLVNNNIDFDLCITSPPYLNSFDYTDVYRPELFLGRFTKSQQSLYNLRKRTLCSHTNVTSKDCNFLSESILYNKAISNLERKTDLYWNSNLPLMVKLYFEQMNDILKRLLEMAKRGGNLWIIVANSAYFNSEIPTDLILADLGSKLGWKLKDIHVLREVFKRGSAYSPDIHSLRESAIVFTK